MGFDELVAHLRDLPDDWGSWLVYADALSERGDVRGQLLVLEHQGAPIRTLADEWMLTWEDRLHSDDIVQYDTFCRLAPLATAPTPTDLRPVFARPISQLLALLEPGAESEGLSPVFELHRQRTLAAVLAWIDRAFDGVPVPDEDHRTIHQAEAADNYERCDRSRDHLGRWQELPVSHLLDNQWSLSHLDEQGIRYYVPAAMSFALRERLPDEHDFWLTESLEYTLQPSEADLRDYEQRRFSLLDRGQRAAIFAFTLIRGHAKAAAAWAHVFEAERHAEREDWFGLYSPTM